MIKLSTVTKTKRDEEKWEKAKEIAAKAGQKDNYAYIMGIYKKMKPDYKFKTSSKLENTPVYVSYVSVTIYNRLTKTYKTILEETVEYEYQSLQEMRKIVQTLDGRRPVQWRWEELDNGLTQASFDLGSETTYVLLRVYVWL